MFETLGILLGFGLMAAIAINVIPMIFCALCVAFGKKDKDN